MTAFLAVAPRHRVLINTGILELRFENQVVDYWALSKTAIHADLIELQRSYVVCKFVQFLVCLKKELLAWSVTHKVHCIQVPFDLRQGPFHLFQPLHIKITSLVYLSPELLETPNPRGPDMAKRQTNLPTK
jgi:hypothetical protein